MNDIVNTGINQYIRELKIVIEKTNKDACFKRIDVLNKYKEIEIAKDIIIESKCFKKTFK